MSAVLDWAWGVKTETTKEKFVLVYLATNFDEPTARSWVSYKQMSMATGLVPVSCSRSVRLLVEAGILRVEMWVAGKQQLINRYSFPPFDGTEAERVTVEVDPGIISTRWHRMGIMTDISRPH